MSCWWIWFSVLIWWSILRYTIIANTNGDFLRLLFPNLDTNILKYVQAFISIILHSITLKLTECILTISFLLNLSLFIWSKLLTMVIRCCILLISIKRTIVNKSSNSNKIKNNDYFCQVHLFVTKTLPLLHLSLFFLGCKSIQLPIVLERILKGKIW